MKNTGGLVNLGAGKWLLVEPDDRIFEHWCTISELHFAGLLPSILFQLTNSGYYSCIFSIARLLLIHKFCFLIILLLPHRFGLCDSPLPLLHCLTSFQLQFPWLTALIISMSAKSHPRRRESGTPNSSFPFESWFLERQP